MSEKMGMTILQAKQRLHEKWMELTKDGTDEEMMQSLSIADTVLGNYDESLKADLVAILTELQSEIEEIDSRAGYDGYGMPTFANDYVRIIKVNEIIQEKINTLKGEEDVDKT